MAQALNTCHVVTDEQDCASFFSHVAHFPDTFLLKRGISYRQHLIHEQDFRFKVCGN